MGTDEAHYIVLTTTLPPPRLSFTRVFDFFSCAEIVQNKGLEHITVDDLVAEITPKGRGVELLLFCMGMCYCMCVCVCVGGGELVGGVLIFNASSVMMVNACLCVCE